MNNITRRLFTRSAPAAVGAAKIAMSSRVALEAYGNSANKCGVPTAAYPGASPGIAGTFIEATASKFWTARKGDATVKALQRLKAMRQRVNGLSVNVLALRSVSDQHKIQMLEADRLRLENEEASVSKRIAKALGIGDDFLRDHFGIGRDD